MNTSSPRPGISLLAAFGSTIIVILAAAFWWFTAVIVRKIVWNHEEGRARMPRHSLKLATLGIITFALLLEVMFARKAGLLRLAGTFYALECAAMLMLFGIDNLLHTPIAKRRPKLEHLIGEVLLHGLWWFEAGYRLYAYARYRTDTRVRQIQYLLPFFVLQIALFDLLITCAVLTTPHWLKAGYLIAGYLFGVMLSRQLDDETRAAWNDLELTPAELKAA